MATFLFSVIVPVYNEEKLLPACLRSLLAQNFPRDQFEVIVVDNNSSDNSAKVAKTFPVRLVEASQQGIVAARDAGAKHSRGAILINLDADCRAPTDYLLRVAEHFAARPELMALTGPYRMPRPDWTVRWITRLMVFGEKLFGKSVAYWGGNFAVRKTAWQKVGGYDPRFPRSDQLSLLYRLNRIGVTSFDPQLMIDSSPRRQQRPLKFLLEGLSYFVDMITVRLWGKSVLRWEDIR